MIITKKIALYNSSDMATGEYWSVAETEKEYDIKIKDTGKKDWGGMTIYEVEGTPLKLNNFADEFCNAENIDELVVA